ncbi:PHD finger protein 14-like [Liolophura sinensis]|uniref:PHD finger protein 14-like n=1 Tax=Liolophura sinensis TaxID=3198878 RepID=UPI00315891EA
MSEDLSIDGVDPSVGFLYKAMLQRDPKKRRVKPVQKHLIQVDFGGADDSDDDSDFEVSKIEDTGSGDSDVGDEPGNDDEEDVAQGESIASERGSSKEVEEEESDLDSMGESASSSHSESEEESDDGPCSVNKALQNVNSDDDSDDEDYIPKKEKLARELNTETPRIKSPDQKSQPPVETQQNDSMPGHLKVIICCVCLGDIRYRDSEHMFVEEDDEIVECDNCGASVHEGCYGISEAQSAASTESSASTEPWFCDACKAGVMPNCELCPNKGGIYKETDAGKWVHLVCALYIPGVAFGDVDKLSPVTLFEMPYSKWGAKECSLCEEPAFSRTGVCISCDAGMCRTFFHVTCAQREGLLSEASPEEDIADPFFAYCKLHADKASMRAKRRNWLAIQSRVKKHSEREIADDKERIRINRKLNRHRQKYVIAKSKRSPSWVPTTKMVRHLSSCPSAVRRMLKKAEVMGIITQVQADPHDKPEKRKKWHMSPALSVEFITHFLDRNAKIATNQEKLSELTNQNDSLREQEKVLRHQYDQSMGVVDRLKHSANQLKDEAEKFWSILSKMGGKQQPVRMPEFLTVKKPLKSPSKRENPRSPPAIIHQCGLCHKSHDQHLLAKCDKCKLHYHLGCLDPPLTRMPKKTKLQGWQCSECGSSSSEESEESNLDVNAPRRLREKIKEPTKFMPTNAYKFDFSKMHERTQKHTGKTRKSGHKRKHENQEDKKQSTEEKNDPPVLKKEKVMPETPLSDKKHKPKPSELKAECCVCDLGGTISNLVRCDECQLCYHFHCLDPPLKKTPKQRGYTWHCEACDPTDNSDEFELEEDAPSEKSPPPPLLKKEFSSGDDSAGKGTPSKVKSKHAR